MSEIFNVVSPHLDDAVLSCTLFLAANPGSCITTVFANGPSSVRPLTRWDRNARYFSEGADVMGIRRDEDARAAALAGATVRHLPYWDRQYRNEQYGYGGPGEEDLLEAVAKDLIRQHQESGASGWVIPLGLGHPDHRLVAEAGLMLAERTTGSLYLYEELPYATEDRADAAERKRRLADRGFTLEEDQTLTFAEDRALKKAAFRCHASQRRQLRWRIRAALRTRERIWRLSR